MIVYFGGHAKNKTIGNSIFEKALPTLPDFYIKVLEINNLSLVIHSYIFIMLLYFCQAMPDLLFIK